MIYKFEWDLGIVYRKRYIFQYIIEMGAEQALIYEPQARRELEAIIKECNSPVDLNNWQIKKMISILAQDLHQVLQYKFTRKNNNAVQQTKKMERIRSMSGNYQSATQTRGIQVTNQSIMKENKNPLDEIQQLRRQMQQQLKISECKYSVIARRLSLDVAEVKNRITSISDSLRNFQKTHSKEELISERSIGLDANDWIDQTSIHFKQANIGYGLITSTDKIHLFGKQKLGQISSFTLKIHTVKERINIGVADRELKERIEFPATERNISYQNNGAFWDGHEWSYLQKNKLVDNMELRVCIDRRVGTVTWKTWDDQIIHSCYNSLLKNPNIVWVIHIALGNGDVVSLIEVKGTE